MISQLEISHSALAVTKEAKPYIGSESFTRKAINRMDWAPLLDSSSGKRAGSIYSTGPIRSTKHRVKERGQFSMRTVGQTVTIT